MSLSAVSLPLLFALGCFSLRTLHYRLELTWLEANRPTFNSRFLEDASTIYEHATHGYALIRDVASTLSNGVPGYSYYIKGILSSETIDDILCNTISHLQLLLNALSAQTPPENQEVSSAYTEIASIISLRKSSQRIFIKPSIAFSVNPEDFLNLLLSSCGKDVALRLWRHMPHETAEQIMPQQIRNSIPKNQQLFLAWKEHPQDVVKRMAYLMNPNRFKLKFDFMRKFGDIRKLSPITKSLALLFGLARTNGHWSEQPFSRLRSVFPVVPEFSMEAFLHLIPEEDRKYLAENAATKLPSDLISVIPKDTETWIVGFSRTVDRIANFRPYSHSSLFWADEIARMGFFQQDRAIHTMPLWNLISQADLSNDNLLTSFDPSMGQFDTPMLEFNLMPDWEVTQFSDEMQWMAWFHQVWNLPFSQRKAVQIDCSSNSKASPTQFLKSNAVQKSLSLQRSMVLTSHNLEALNRQSLHKNEKTSIQKEQDNVKASSFDDSISDLTDDSALKNDGRFQPSHDGLS